MPSSHEDNAQGQGERDASNTSIGPRGFFFFESRIFLRAMAVLASIGCFLILAYSFHAGTVSQFLRVASVGILVAGAASLTGCLMGFIFGIPRVGAPAAGDRKGPPDRENRAPESADADALNSDEPTYFVGRNSHDLRNGNLVEISDWLTKIIVGVGLVELHPILSSLGKLSYHLAPGLMPVPCVPGASCAEALSSAQAAGMAILIFYFALGFLMGYVWTMVFFPSDLKEENWLLSKLIERRNITLARKNKELNQKNDTLARLAQTTNALFSAEGHISKDQLDEAMAIIDKAITDDPKSGSAIMTKARILKRQAMKSNPLDRDTLKQAIVCVDRAIALLPEKGEPIYNKACYQALLDPIGLKSEVIANLQSAFRLNPDLRQIMRDEPDLASMAQDADFVNLTGQTPPPTA